jgi:alkylation response protein AidB-like acyl-CoA dehydrogenase
METEQFTTPLGFLDDKLGDIPGKDKIATRTVPTGEVELRDSEAWLLGKREQGIYLILEVLNISRVANSIASVALAHRQILDGLEVMQRKAAHKNLFELLRPIADARVLAGIEARVDQHLALEEGEQEAGAETLFHDLASFCAETFLKESLTR